MKIEQITKSTIEMQMARKVILNILYTNGLINENMSEMLKPFDLSTEQYNVLRILRGQKSCPANMCVIQERMITKNSNTTRLIDKLLLKDLVTRNVCPNNRRKIEVSITQKGLEILEQLDPKLIEHENFFAQNLTSNELSLLNELLEKIRTKN
ncbi:MarR family winged helix-turn-helix transcriptional regulator [Flavobacterium croceum]|uniref:MarR family transcriptional regulator n=1 Tax=Flavobacterium croceum DSM 17960 TaxID=1121886 RepID=A0A2S4N7T7_9FLAO|nr:MarR family transcriptional regulator [Flavobacterium croceum]POS01758.1 MarR family transcriptional regulator [Flavobacterium croceum DSM 17960]